MPLAAFQVVDVYAGGGYRRDHLRWSIGADGINILSELTYRELDSVELQLGGELLFDHWLLVGARGSLGYLFSGWDQDSDYVEDDRVGEWSLSCSRVTGNVAEARIYAGRALCWQRCLRVVPRVGLAWNQLYLRSGDGYSLKHPVHDWDDEIVGVVEECWKLGDGINSTYRAEWFTGYASLELLWRYTRRPIVLRAEGQIHGGLFHGCGDWRLREDFDPFHDYAGARGLTGELSAFFGIRRGLWWYLRCSGQYWTTEEGRAVFYHPDGDKGEQPFNRATWSSLRASIGLASTF